MIRLVVSFLFLCLYLLYSLPYFWRARWLDRRGQIEKRDRLTFNLARRWAQFMVRVTGSKVEVSGMEHIPNSGGVAFISNHQGIFDIPLLIGYIPKNLGFIAKQELLKVPVIGMWMSYLHCVFMDRSNVRQSLRAINQGAEHIRQGYSLVIFPEGTRSKSGELLDFKPGSFKLAVKAEAPIVPVTIIDSNRIFGDDKKIRASHVKIIISPPVYLHDFAERDTNELSQHVRQIIDANLREVNA